MTTVLDHDRSENARLLPIHAHLYGIDSLTFAADIFRIRGCRDAENGSLRTARSYRGGGRIYDGFQQPADVGI